MKINGVDENDVKALRKIAEGTSDTAEQTDLQIIASALLQIIEPSRPEQGWKPKWYKPPTLESDVVDGGVV